MSDIGLREMAFLWMNDLLNLNNVLLLFLATWKKMGHTVKPGMLEAIKDFEKELRQTSQDISSSEISDEQVLVLGKSAVNKFSDLMELFREEIEGFIL